MIHQQRDKRNLQLRKDAFVICTGNSAEDNAEHVADLAIANASLDATNTMLATLADGDAKETRLIKKWSWS